MADNRFSIEVGVSGVAKAQKDFTSLQKEIINVDKEFRKAQATALGLEGELNSLSNQLKTGAISQRNFNKEQKEILTALSSARQATQQYQSRLTSLNATLAQGDNIGRQYGNSIKQLQGVHDSVSTGIRGSTTIGVEFGRMLGDLPYGIQGVANNLQQLTTNFGYYTNNIKESLIAQGKQATAMNIAKTAISGILSPMSLLTIGVSAVTAGWVLYEKWAQKSAKATREKKEETQKYIETLSGLQRAQANGLNEAQKELTTLDQLYKATQNLTLPMKTRKEAADELIKQYPEQLKGLSQEEILAGKASKAYDTLSKSITATAIATASASKLTENAQKQLNNYLEIIDKQNEANKLQASIEKTRKNFTTSALGAGVGASGAAQSNVVAKDFETYSNLLKDINSLGADNLKISKENEQIQKLINTQLESGASITGRVGGTLSSIGGTVSKLANDSNSILKDSLNYYDAKLLSIQEKYDKIYATVKDDGLLKLAKENEYAEKLRVNVEKLLDATKQLKGTSNINITGTLSGLPTSAGLINSSAGQLASNRMNSTTDNSKLENRLARTIENGLKKGIEDILGDIDNLGSNFYDVFSNVFGKLSSNFTSLMSGVISTSLADGLSEKFSSGEFELWEGLGDKTSKALVAGATLGGKILGGLISQSSAVGQAGAGALSGAGAGGGIGALFSKSGGIWGAAIGGVIGAISGIFGSSKAKKAEELQRQQLEEQKKTNGILERQQLLAYSSSVIGQMTNAGIVQSVDRNEFGDLVTTIKGSTLEILLQRAKSERGS